MRKPLRWTVGCLVILGLASAPDAEATLMIAVDVNGVQACAVDNNAACAFGTQILDIDPAVGVMSFGNTPQMVGILTVSGSVQQATFGPPSNILNTSSTQITNTGSVLANAFIAVSATDFVPPVSQAFASGSATWEDAAGSAIQMQWYNDPLNQQGAETATDLPGILLSACSDPITLTADSTACDGTASLTEVAPFSMTLFTQFTLTPGGTVVNRGQTLLKPLAPPPMIPEPASLLLLSSAFGAAGYVARNRARRRKPADA